MYFTYDQKTRQAPRANVGRLSRFLLIQVSISTEILQYIYFGCKISVNYAQNLQGKHEDFTDILCDLVTLNVVKSTDFLALVKCL